MIHHHKLEFLGSSLVCGCIVSISCGIYNHSQMSYPAGRQTTWHVQVQALENMALFTI